MKKEQDKVFYFEGQLERKTSELNIVSGAENDFLSVCSFLMNLSSSSNTNEIVL
jgi:hypothetical protein